MKVLLYFPHTFWKYCIIRCARSDSYASRFSGPVYEKYLTFEPDDPADSPAEHQNEEETETVGEREEPLGSPGRALVKADRRCQLRPPLEVTGAAGVEKVEVIRHPRPNL